MAFLCLAPPPQLFASTTTETAPGIQWVLTSRWLGERGITCFLELLQEPTLCPTRYAPPALRLVGVPSVQLLPVKVGTDGLEARPHRLRKMLPRMTVRGFS